MRTFSTIICSLLAVVLSTTGGIAAVDETSPHGPLSVACNACHTTEGWSTLRPALDFDHAQTRFPLIGRHTSVSCIGCHPSLTFADAGTNCRDCHLDIHRGQFAQNTCEECHTPARWNNEEEMLARHQHTRFPLVGVHSTLDCRQCHEGGQFVNTAVDCQGCHLDDFQRAVVPDHDAAGLPTDCEQCHSITAPKWLAVNFDHAATSVACYSCHRPDYERTTNPGHREGQFSHDCAICHTNFSSWRPANFDHNASGFPLTGAHATVNCTQCHISGQYSGTSSVCFDCHRTDYESAADPNHAAGNFSHECAVCHSTDGWSPASFDHNLSDFPLTGAHISVSCASCHVNGQFTGTSSACYSCHQDDYEAVGDPNHVTGNFSQACTDCHTTDGWTPATFNHDGTNFPLTGAHITASCSQCHVDGQFTGTPTDCWSCHETDYNGASDPNHAADQYPHDCAECHSTTAWEPASFNHDGTAFPLTGAHVSVSCALCHVNGQFAGTPTDCWSCHEDDYNATTDPNHAANQFGHDCLLCHSTSAWEPSTFNHDQSQFPLTGAHVQVNCAECHVNGQYQGTPTDCWSCHQEDYNDANDPDHAGNDFSHDCTECHNTNSWDEGLYDHGQTDFPLTGAHITLDCIACHASGVYDGLPADCWSCHQDDFEGVADPNHVSGNFSHICTDCHSTSAWVPATFDHNQTDFPLTGAHLNATCAQCHINGQFEGTPTECFFCHQADYNGATNPNHIAAGFPTTCQECHGTSNWSSNWNHDLLYFPIYSGRHQGEWNLCADCHIVPNNYAIFSCIDCHEHNQQDTDDDHSEVPGYVYESNACLACHPTGEGDVRLPRYVPNQK